MTATKFQNKDVVVAALQQSTIAIIGLSPNPARPSYGVAEYMLNHGYEIIPVNPRESEILGQKSYPSLQDIPKPITLVDVFRDASAVPDIVEDAIAVQAKYLWLQLGVIHQPAASKATDAEIGVVMDLCLKIEHARYQQLL